MQLLHGDCRTVMAGMDAESIDAIVTDPPYGIEFMGKTWDSLDDPVSKSWTTKGRKMADAPSPTPDSPGGRHGAQVHRNPNPRCDNCGRAVNGRDTPKGFRVCSCEHPAPRLSNTYAIRMQSWHESWAREAYRVLKPGGHMFVFGGTRTVHRLTCAIEDAGFEIRDKCLWLYGSGFPKSHDVSKAMDKRRDDEVRPVCRFLESHLGDRRIIDIVRALGFAGNGDHGVSAWFRENHVSPRVPTWAQWLALKALLGFGDEMDAEVWRLNDRKGQSGEAWDEREVVGISSHKSGIANAVDGHYTVGGTKAEHYDITAPATDLAREWQGWGTALKPGHEDIVLARKPLIGTVATNVERHGTGALHIDGCRIASGDAFGGGANGSGGYHGVDGYTGGDGWVAGSSLGRWPANVILGHSPECREVGVKRMKGSNRPGPATAGAFGRNGVYGAAEGGLHPSTFADPDGYETVTAWECAPDCAVAMLDAQSGERKSGTHVRSRGETRHVYGTHRDTPYQGLDDTGGASRFFYCAKSSRAERNAGLEGMPERRVDSDYRQGGFGNDRAEGKYAVASNHHPTVKPVALMRWLCRLITPPNGTILDPFLGSGTTGIAAVLEGFAFVGIEQDADYLAIAERRIAHWTREAKKAESLGPLFDMAAD